MSFPDCDGLICRGGRIHNPPLSESAKFPYLLPQIHLFTALIVTDTHMKQLHASVNATVTALRQSFWRPSICQYVRKPLKNCVICNNKLQGPLFKPPDLTPLRKVRVQEAAPFAVHRGGLYWTTICMMREWGDQMLYISLYLCCNKSGTLGSLF